MVQHQFQQNHLDRILLLSKDSVSSLKEMVSVTAPKITRTVSLVTSLQNICALRPSNIEHDFYVEPELKELVISNIHRRSLRFFCKEALTNAARHSQASKIEIRLERDKAGVIWFSMQDNGKGIQEDVLEDPTSLSTLHLRAQEMEAEFRINSSPEGGLKVAVSLKELK